MKLSYIIIVVFFLLWSCSSWEKTMIVKGNQDDAIQNAIYDFLNSEKIDKRDSIFGIYVKTISDEILGITIRADANPLLVVTEDNINYNYRGFPTMYFENRGKLFYWDDPTKSVNTDIISIFTKYNLIDTMILNVYIPEIMIDHSKKSVDYYYCKNNLQRYKKVRTKKAMGYYQPPKLRCK